MAPTATPKPRKKGSSAKSSFHSRTAGVVKGTTRSQKAISSGKSALRVRAESMSEKAAVIAHVNRRKAGGARARRVMIEREPKLTENPKKTLLIKGRKSSAVTKELLSDLGRLAGPQGVPMRKKNDILPFEDVSSIEFLSDKNDASLFALASHSTKRPHNVIFGRLFNHQMLDMMEFSVEDYHSISSFKGSGWILGSKPALVFQGDEWSTSSKLSRAKSLLTDIFKGPTVPAVVLSAMDHAMVFTAAAGRVYLRHYLLKFKKSGTRTPLVQIDEVGPSMTLIPGRVQEPHKDTWSVALRKPRGHDTSKLKKNMEIAAGGDRVGRIHMTRQDLSQLTTRRFKGTSSKAPLPEQEGDVEEMDE